MRLGVSGAVVDDRIIPGDVEIEGGLVKAVGVGDGKGTGLAVPGFVDVHVHGHDGVDFVDATIEDHRSIARALTSTGVTAYNPTLMSMPVERLLQALRTHPGDVPGGARTLGFHLEGPFLSPRRAGAHRPEDLLAPTVEVAEALLAAGPVEHMTVAPEGAEDLIAFLVKAGVVVHLGHSEASAEETNGAIELGARAATHVFNAMRPIDHRNPGILDVVLASDTLLPTAIFDGAHLSDEAASIVIRCAGSRLVAITDGTSAIGIAKGQAFLGGNPVEIIDGVPRLADGTIAGSVLTMDQAFRNLLDLGLSLPQATRATSGNPALLAGRQDLAIIAPGTPADIAVLDDSYQIKRTTVAGQEVFAA